jgi:LIVCS family branched-chain amino acid:cation transporter
MNKLTRAQYFFVGSMLFGMMFGAGNLIFPVHMGQMAGAAFWPANWGFISTGVFMPVIALIALGISGADSVQDLANRVHPLFSKVFVVMLYLTIGPCFALPRTASVSFQVGVAPFIAPAHQFPVMVAFTGIFMLIALLLGLKPSKLVVYIGKFLNPVFLLFLAFLVGTALFHPMGDLTAFAPQGAYAVQPYLTGFKEGYNTMDVLAVIAFAIVVIQTIQGIGVTDRVAMAKDIFKVGLIVMAFMTLIYTAITWLGASSLGKLAISANGGIALAEIAQYYFGPAGMLLQAIIVTLACLKTAIGLVTSCSEAFAGAFPGSLSYRKYCYVMAGFSFVVANVGLTQIIALAIPVLMFTYPIGIALILSTYVAYFFRNDRRIYCWPAVLTTLAAIGDAFSVLPAGIRETRIGSLILKFHAMLPLADSGMAWVMPTLLGILIALGLIKMTGVRPLENNR